MTRPAAYQTQIDADMAPREGTGKSDGRDPFQQLEGLRDTCLRLLADSRRLREKSKTLLHQSQNLRSQFLFKKGGLPTG